MTVRYVDGDNGNNSWDGLAPNFVSGTNGPKATLNGAEDTPVTAGDIVHVRGVGSNGVPIAYRELLTIDVSGTAGNPIEYRADVGGIIWPIGNLVRITGSDNDQTATRANCVTATSKDYRTFTGFAFDTTTAALVTLLTACGNWIIQDCYFQGLGANANSINIGGTGTTNTIRRCVFPPTRGTMLGFNHTSTVSNAAHVVDNCVFIGSRGTAVSSTRIGGITTRHCLFWGCSTGVQVVTALAGGQTMPVNNCLFTANGSGCVGTVAGEIVENYNSFWGNATDRTNTNTGANSNILSPLFNQIVLLSGFAYLQGASYGLSEWSPLRQITGTGMSSDDLYGMTRTATDAKKSWGPIQFNGVGRDTGTKRTGAAAVRLNDAKRYQILVPVSNVSTIFSVYVQWEANYAGTKPQMVIKQPGQSDTTVTATGSSGAWELLTTTITPAANPSYVIMELVSNNTAVAASITTYFDDALVIPAGTTGGFDIFVNSRNPFNVLSQPSAAVPIISGAIAR